MSLRLGCTYLWKNYWISCKFTKGTFPVHCELNDILKRVFSLINIPTKLVPWGLSRDDCKCPDVITLEFWSKGCPLIWDAICWHTSAFVYKTNFCQNWICGWISKQKKTSFYKFQVVAFNSNIKNWHTNGENFRRRTLRTLFETEIFFGYSKRKCQKHSGSFPKSVEFHEMLHP